MTRRLPNPTAPYTLGDGGGQNVHLEEEEELWAHELLRQRAEEHFGPRFGNVGTLEEDIAALLQAFPADQDLARAAEITRWGLGARGSPELTPRLNFVPGRDTLRVDQGPETEVVVPPMRYQPTKLRGG